jgi:hypothetical protein
MHPSHLWRARWLRWLAICVAAPTAVVVVAVVIVAAGLISSRPQVTQSATPHGPVTLIPGTRVTDGVQLGFPHTTIGAISAAADMVSEVFSTLDPSHAEATMRLLADSSYPTALGLAVGAVESYRELGHLAATGREPAGYTLSFEAEEYQVRHVTANKVIVILLCKSSFTESDGEEYVQSGVLGFVMHWEHGDWKVAGDTNTPYASLFASADSSRAIRLGWRPLRVRV